MRRTLLPAIMPVVILVVLSLGACTVATVPAPAPAPAETQAPAPVAPAETQAPAASEPASPANTQPPAAEAQATAPAAEGQASGQPATLTAPRAGALDSYVARVEYKQLQVKPEQIRSWVTMEVRYQDEPAPGAYAMTMTDMQAGKSQMQMVVVGDDGYILTPEQGDKWLKVPMVGGVAEAVSSSLLDPNQLAEDAPAGTFTQANLVSPHEAVDGQDTSHYRLKDATLAELIKAGNPDSKLVSGQADMWVSNSGGYVKKYAIDVLTQDPDGAQVQETGTLEVTNENKPAGIATPQPNQVTVMESQAPSAAATPSGLASPQGKQALSTVPAPPKGKAAGADALSPAVSDALQVYQTPGLPSSTFTSAETVPNIYNFYRTQLKNLGWAETMVESGNTVEQPSLMIYTKGSLNLEIVIMPDTAKKQSVVFVQVDG